MSNEVQYEKWEPVIGLEIHVQLNTRTKLYGNARNHFGDEPNTNIDEVDTAQPGVLPVLNKEAVKKAVLFGLAIGSTIAYESRFDRKSYFYPDNPRNFQITQFDHPIIRRGVITCDVGNETKHFPIDRAHIEDDSGMLKHFSSFAGVDFNRAGIPLLEIVSEPAMRSPKEASAFATTVRAIMQYIGASDCNMEEGSLRMDVNVSVRPKGTDELRPKIEIKNMNSFHNMELAIEAEIRRQIEAYSLYPIKPFAEAVLPGTYRFDLKSGKTILMRRKEEALDYRYFPEPDLPPIFLEESQITTWKAELPELPHQRYLRYTQELKLPLDSAAILTADKYTSDFFEEALPKVKNPSALCNWIITEFAGRLKEKGITLKQSNVKSKYVGNLLQMIEEKVITGRIAKQVADDMLENPEKDSRAIVKENPNYQPVQDTSVIEPIVDKILSENSQSVTDYLAGRKKAFAYLVGQVMKETKGKASPEVVNQLLTTKIGEKGSGSST